MIWWRAEPVGSAMAAAGLLTVGAVIDQPVQDGFALALVTGVLIWACAALATVRGWVVVIALTGSLLVSGLLNHPENAPLAMALVFLALVGGVTERPSTTPLERSGAWSPGNCTTSSRTPSA